MVTKQIGDDGFSEEQLKAFATARAARETPEGVAKLDQTLREFSDAVGKLSPIEKEALVVVRRVLWATTTHTDCENSDDDEIADRAAAFVILTLARDFRIEKRQ